MLYSFIVTWYRVFPLHTNTLNKRRYENGIADRGRRDNIARGYGCIKKAGYEVVIAHNGKEGFEKIDNGTYDIVLTDVLMPYASGLEVINRIKTDPEKYKTGVLVISSIGNEELVTEAFKLGADDYMKKPIMIGELQMRMERILSRKAA